MGRVLRPVLTPDSFRSRKGRMGGDTEHRGPYSSDTPAELRSELLWVRTDGHLFELRT